MVRAVTDTPPDDNEIAHLWDTNADVWTRHVRAGYDRFRDLYNTPAFLDLIGDVAGLKLLDAACGEGRNTRQFARRGARVTGVDGAPRMIALARQEEDREPLGICYEVAPMADMACFADASFDGVVSTMALMDCADYRGAIDEFARVIRPGGMLAFSITHPCFDFDLDDRQWVRDDTGRVVGIRLGNYFRGGFGRFSWKFSAASEDVASRPFDSVYFDRTLSDYINPVCEAGFLIERIMEPRPTDEACRTEPGLQPHRLIPHSLLLRARRPGG